MCYSHLVDFVNESHGIQEAQGQPQEEKEDEVGNQKDIDIK
jgi:hypothetical protein